MKYLLYGVVQQSSTESTPEPGICLLAAHGLAAAVSVVEEDMTSPPSISSLLAYERVVEAIHDRQAVIPLRYGCIMESESAVIRLLKEHHQEYAALLARLLGMTEIGIRVLWPARTGVPPSLPSSPGSRYLASLRKRYNSANDLAPEEVQLSDQIVRLLSGRFTEQRREVMSCTQGRLVSLYFLTPKIHTEEFRQEARQIRAPRGAKLLLSGPWAPYNFVTSCG